MSVKRYFVRYTGLSNRRDYGTDIQVVLASDHEAEVERLQSVIDARDKAAGFEEVQALSPEARQAFRAAVQEIDGVNLREVERLRSHLAESTKENGLLVQRVLVLDERLAAAEADAKRYRWLRGDGGPQSLRWPRWSIQHWTGFWNPVQGEGMDAAIDAHLSAAPAGAGEAT